MSDMDKIITSLFKEYWRGPQRDDLKLAKKQLYKNLTDQLNGYWSGHTAYQVMVNGGFLIDAKHGEKKHLTTLGKLFISNYEKELKTNSEE